MLVKQAIEKQPQTQFGCAPRRLQVWTQFNWAKTSKQKVYPQFVSKTFVQYIGRSLTELELLLRHVFDAL